MKRLVVNVVGEKGKSKKLDFRWMNRLVERRTDRRSFLLPFESSGEKFSFERE